MSSDGAYTVAFSDRAIRDLKRLDGGVLQRVRKKIEEMASQATTFHHKRLQENLGDYFRLRVGKYRVIYQLDHQLRRVLIVAIGNRDDIYG